MPDDIEERLHRIYEAIEAIEESDPDKLRSIVYQTEKFTFVHQDFRAGMPNLTDCMRCTS